MQWFLWSWYLLQYVSLDILSFIDSIYFASIDFYNSLDSCTVLCDSNEISSNIYTTLDINQWLICFFFCRSVNNLELVVYLQVYSFLKCLYDSFYLSILKVKEYFYMTDDKIKESGNLYFLPSYFHSFLQDNHSKYKENHVKKFLPSSYKRLTISWPMNSK